MTQKTKRQSVYLIPEKQEQLERITHYLKEAYVIPEVRNFSVVIGFLIDTFEELFLENNTSAYYDRLADLKDRQSSKDAISNELKLLAKQLDLITYLGLSNFHATTGGPMWNIDDLTAIHSMDDPHQTQLLSHIEDLIQKDKSRGQVMKHS
ncbi:UNVERIFIED_CONTAM: hypothetical protein KB581_08455 [Streptococcus canis]|uniref:Uncharacterized protein n=1 Tax=Streptococcus canis TaxID=1329 RepID=A0AAE4TRV3_STRCB|nr:hypothetical protein [Streptococcus canis]MDV5977433.1 hypothetical protein [Streptococcus canis]MDW7799019.1 hypothetical protein [Streptococcus canis]GAY71428.1 uncharacterized protein TANIYAMA4_1949 [Streptococcus canis]GFE44960.1 hypothetical protein ScFU6_07290 [Streptococcus canis]